jgi:phytoene desaturase
MAKRIIVVGAGPGGLAAAMLLARAGARVKVVERLDRVGGRTSTITTKGGFKFDLGPTFFLYPKILEEIFAACGRELSDEVTLRRLDPQYRLVFEAGGELLATPNVHRMEEAVARISPEDAKNVRRFLTDNRIKFSEFEPCLQKHFSSWRDVATPRMLRMLPRLRPWQSLDSHLQSYFKDPRVRLSFCFQAKYLGMSPFVCPSLFSILSFLEYEYGVFHPVGGCGALTEAMARVARDLGVEIALEEPVEQILFRGRRAVGVKTPSGEEYADAVIVNADFARAMGSMVPDHLRRRWSDRQIAKKKFSCSTFMLYLGVRGTYRNVHHHNIFLAENYVQNLHDIEKGHVLSGNPSFYVQNACVTDSTLAPAGMSTLYVLLPVSHQHANIDWTREKEFYRALALRQLAKVGIRGVEERIVYEKCVTPADWDSAYNIHLGATFNLAHSFDQMLHLRPQNRFEEFDGMYLVGGGTHPGSGLPVIFESARITSRLVMEDLALKPDAAVREIVANPDADAELAEIL